MSSPHRSRLLSELPQIQQVSGESSLDGKTFLGTVLVLRLRPGGVFRVHCSICFLMHRGSERLFMICHAFACAVHTGRPVERITTFATTSGVLWVICSFRACGSLMVVSCVRVILCSARSPAAIRTDSRMKPSHLPDHTCPGKRDRTDG